MAARSGSVKRVASTGMCPRLCFYVHARALHGTGSAHSELVLQMTTNIRGDPHEEYCSRACVRRASYVLKVAEKDGDRYLVMNATKEALQSAPGYTFDRTKGVWVPETKKPS